jgi:ribosomal protein L11 methyltransferase
MTGTAQPHLVELVIRVPVAHEELALSALLELSPAGIRHDEPTGDDGSGLVEFGLYVGVGERATIETYLARAGVGVVSYDELPVAPDWGERWKEFHRPVIIGELWVGPPWDLDAAPASCKRVVIEPGQGFGTGAHPTTRLVLSLLSSQPRASVLDIGCGSGVLSIAAHVLGFGPITAIDNDPAAIASTHDNLARNSITNIDVRLIDARQDALLSADIVLANLTLEPLQQIAPLVQAPRLIVSGLLRSQVPAAAAAYSMYGYVVREQRDRDGWSALVLDSTDAERVMRHRDAL